VARRVYRCEKGRMIGGVCSGVTEYFDVDPVWVRVSFALLALANGLGLLAYSLLWIFIPRKSQVSVPTEQVIKEEVEFFKERLQQMEERARGLFAPAETSSDSQDDEAPAAAPEEGRPRGGAWGLFAVGMALIMVGMILVFNNFALLWWLDLGRLWPLTFIAVGFVLLLSRRGR